MDWNKRINTGLLLLLLLLSSCSVSYRLDGGSINYNLTKTITIQEFVSRVSGNPLLTQILDQQLTTRFIEQTQLTPVSRDGDIDISGEITRYDTQDLAVKEDSYASRTRLNISIRVQYTNSKEPDQDIDQTFTAFREYDNNQNLQDVEDQLCREICEELVDQIYNATVANW